MNKLHLHKILIYFIASVWMINGLLCKVLMLTPRHQEIVGRILGSENERVFTIVIGVLEVAMAVWILTQISSKVNAILQIIIVLTMNMIEFAVVPDLLLWGKLNLLFAVIFCGIIFCTEFVLLRKSTART
jgi:hypothetical protein